MLLSLLIYPKSEVILSKTDAALHLPLPIALHITMEWWLQTAHIKWSFDSGRLHKHEFHSLYWTLSSPWYFKYNTLYNNAPTREILLTHIGNMQYEVRFFFQPFISIVWCNTTQLNNLLYKLLVVWMGWK